MEVVQVMVVEVDDEPDDELSTRLMQVEKEVGQQDEQQQFRSGKRKSI